MAATIEKKTPAKKKTATKTTAAKVTTVKTETATSKPTAEKSKVHTYSQEDVARLAHKYWAERGGHHGSHEQDWFRAEQELRSKAS